VGLVTGQPVQLADGDGVGSAAVLEMDDGVERDQRHSHVRGVGGDTGWRPAQDGEIAVIALQRWTPRPRHSLVARLGDVLEVQTAGALEEIATHGGHVAQLARSTVQHGAGEHRQLPSDHVVGDEVAVADAGADPDAAGVGRLDAVEREAGDVDQQLGRLDAELHQVDQVGAAGEEGGRRGAGHRLDGSRRVGGPFVGEPSHRAMSRIAGTMLA
jgi:hypothetical protein